MPVEAAPRVKHILLYRALSAWRLAQQQAFGLLALGPLFLGVALWITSRYLELFHEALATQWGFGPDGAMGWIGFVLTLLIGASGLPYVLRELFTHSGPRLWVEVLPVPGASRFAAACAVCLAHNLPAAAVLFFVAGWLWPPAPLPAGLLWAQTGHLILALVPLTLLQMLLVQGLVHARRWTPKTGLQRYLGIVCRLLALLVTLALAGVPAYQIAALLQPGSQPSGGGWGVSASVVLCALLVALTRNLHLRWHRRDLELAVSPERAALRASRSWVAALGTWLEPAVKTQVERDILLVVRRFSPVVDLAVLLALTCYGVVLGFLPNSGWTASWQLRWTAIGCLVATLALSAVVLFVVHDQLPRFWLVKTSGVAAAAVWRAKVWLAGALALPTVVAGAWIVLAAGLRLGAGSADVVAAVLGFVLGALMAALTFGLIAFEVPEQPLLGLLASSLVGSAFALLTIFVPLGSWLWLIGFGVVASQLAGRADRRVALTGSA